MKKSKTSSRAPARASVSKSDQGDVLVALPHPELVFGLVGPAGTDLKKIFEALKGSLESVGYNVPKEPIRLSGLLASFLDRDYSGLPEDERIDKLMTAGTTLREVTKRGDAVALLAVMEISRIRKEVYKNENQKMAYVLHSLKHPREIETLRNIYGKGFFAISVYSPREERVTALAKRIQRSRAGQSDAYARSRAEKLIERDESEEGRDLGQDVKDAFPMADLFVDARAQGVAKANIDRFVELLFGNWAHTPTADEYAMYHAKSAAVRSSDLGRQVGAAIAHAGDIVSVGCNDVPKFGGGLYWTGDSPDGRDFQLGQDSSYEHREQMLAEILSRLCDNKWLDEGFRGRARELVAGSSKGMLKGTQLFGLLEFGRSVHAEMASLSDAARRGTSVRHSTMYSTTFPCHICAKHIVAAGISRVVYIEPYPKSRAKELFSDSISVDPAGPTEGLVRFEAFVGVAPRQYLDLFQTDGVDRKDGAGKVRHWTKDQARPRVTRFMNTYLEIEVVVVGQTIAGFRRLVNENKDRFRDTGDQR